MNEQIETNTDSNRKLVSIQKIIDVTPIENADLIETCRVLGYTVVCGKNQFKKDDKCIFFEPDSIIPENILVKANLWDVIKNKGKLSGSDGKRLRTVKLRGVISQGLALPFSAIPLRDVYHDGGGVLKEAYPVGTDMTQILGVTKYEPVLPAQLIGKIKGQFPQFLIKSDQLNVQTYPDVLKEIQGKKIFVTIKMDGTSVTYYDKPDLVDWGKDEFGVCSRNLDLKPDDTIYWQMAKKYDIERKLKELAPWYGVQGECYGPGIQDNRMGAKEHQFAVYDILDIRNCCFVGWDEFKAIVGRLDLPVVPVIFEGICPWATYEEVMNFADQQMYGKDLPAEGIVIKTWDESTSEVLEGRLSFKAISRVFKLKYPRA